MDLIKLQLLKEKNAHEYNKVVRCIVKKINYVVDSIPSLNGLKISYPFNLEKFSLILVDRDEVKKALKEERNNFFNILSEDDIDTLLSNINASEIKTQEGKSVVFVNFLDVFSLLYELALAEVNISDYIIYKHIFDKSLFENDKIIVCEPVKNIDIYNKCVDINKFIDIVAPNIMKVKIDKKFELYIEDNYAYDNIDVTISYYSLKLICKENKKIPQWIKDRILNYIRVNESLIFNLSELMFELF